MNWIMNVGSCELKKKNGRTSRRSLEISCLGPGQCFCLELSLSTWCRRLALTCWRRVRQSVHQGSICTCCAPHKVKCDTSLESTREALSVFPHHPPCFSSLGMRAGGSTDAGKWILLYTVCQMWIPMGGAMIWICLLEYSEIDLERSKLWEIPFKHESWGEIEIIIIP